MNQLQKLISVHTANRQGYSSNTAYRGVSYDVDSALTTEHAYVKREFVYRGQKYTETVKVEVGQ